MTCDFSGLVGKKVTDKEGFSGTILGVYSRQDGIFLCLVYGAIDTYLVFILQNEKEDSIIEVGSEDFYENFKIA